MKNIFILFVLTLLFGCNSDCVIRKQGHAELIGYRVSKHSHLKFRIVETGSEHIVSSMGGRREPNIPLGTVVDCIYFEDTCNGKIGIVIDGSKYGKYPADTRSRNFNCD